jgi:hypothetical protein
MMIATTLIPRLAFISQQTITLVPRLAFVAKPSVTGATWSNSLFQFFNV